MSADITTIVTLIEADTAGVEKRVGLQIIGLRR